MMPFIKACYVFGLRLNGLAMRQTGAPMSFETFRNSDMFQFWIYDPNPDAFLQSMRLLQSNFSLCLPFVGDSDDQPDIPQNFFACHAATTREDKKIKKGLNVA